MLERRHPSRSGAATSIGQVLDLIVAGIEDRDVAKARTGMPLR
jgi:hypothetical protein